MAEARPRPRPAPLGGEPLRQRRSSLDPATNTLLIAQGGNTNIGAPSNNFALLPEFALSAAILSVDLDAIGNTTYDLPTLDDEARPGTTDANDPFGGNNGKNQARLVPGGPVQVYSPGFRNPYDLVITESGNMYTIDNGGNAGWGDVPAQPDDASRHLHQQSVTSPATATATPCIRIPGRASTAATRTRPAPTGPTPSTRATRSRRCRRPIPSRATTAPRPSEGHWRPSAPRPTGSTSTPRRTSAGAMKGDLLAASFDDTIYRIKLNAAGTAVTSATAALLLGGRPAARRDGTGRRRPVRGHDLGGGPAAATPWSSSSRTTSACSRRRRRRPRPRRGRRRLQQRRRDRQRHQPLLRGRRAAGRRRGRHLRPQRPRRRQRRAARHRRSLRHRREQRTEHGAARRATRGTTTRRPPAGCSASGSRA